MLKLCFPIIVLLFAGNISLAQGVKKYTTPLAGKVVFSEVDDKYNATVIGAEMPEPDANAEQVKLREIKKQVARMYPYQKGPQHKTSSSVMAPIVGVNFVADSITDIPPDNCSAISAGNKIVTVMNSYVTVHDATTGAYLMRKGLSPFSVSAGLTGATDYRYDPKVIYDPGADRFICIMLSGEDEFNNIVVGFSQSNDPTGTWNFYKFHGDYKPDTTWFDYPAISITKNEFFFTGNKIRYDSSWQAGFTRSLIYQVRKQDGYDGDSLLTYQIWDSVQYNNKFLRCLHPLSPGDGLQGPSQYFLSDRNFDTINDTVFLVKVPDTIGSADTILTVTPLVSTTSYGVPPDARQPDTTLTLATNDGRVLGGFITANEIQFVSTSSNPLTGGSAIYHGVISNYSTAPALQGQLISVDSLDFGYPNISYSGNVAGYNQSIISFDYSGPHTYPGMGAVLFDGSNYSDMVIVKTGDSTINRQGPGEQRWGDYSGTQPDWSVPGAVWVNGIYGRRDRFYRHTYGNYMAQLISPYHEGVSPVAKQAVLPANLYPNPGLEYICFEFTVVKEQVFSFYIYDINGKLVDKVLDNFCHEGQNVLKFNIAPLAPGTYFLKATGTLGESLPAKMFVRQ